jgi:menaquinone-dependent protoporphyrinogen oxidase
MTHKILVTYASRLGSTGEVAHVIAQTLAESRAEVDIYPVQRVQDPGLYDAVILGSAIRFGKWLPDAMEFVSANREFLNSIPTAFFTVCMTMSQDTEENRRKASNYLNPVRALVTPVDEAWFAGKLDYSQLTFLQRVVEKIQGLPAGDFRDWKEIRAWANTPI